MSKTAKQLTFRLRNAIKYGGITNFVEEYVDFIGKNTDAQSMLEEALNNCSKSGILTKRKFKRI